MFPFIRVQMSKSICITCIFVYPLSSRIYNLFDAGLLLTQILVTVIINKVLQRKMF